MKKSKGFTLVELLAVIVILAVLVLFATPAVTSIMQGSQQKALKNEVLELVKNVQTYYSTEIINGATQVTSANKDKMNTYHAKIVNLSKDVGGNPKSYKYLCMTLQDLVDKQVVTKNFNQYGGYIQLWIDEEGKSTIYVNVYNSSYYMQGLYDYVSKPDYLPSQDPISESGTGKPAEPTVGLDGSGVPNFSCPTNGKIPDSKFHN